ncbi:capsular polysaccharide synthesis protein [uncultured Bacteroides sp.]|jgi:hypothetical protein|uniref:capsular polysaccharide synthesis protein n=1 Tax=uncultured Bacteroides sp. TaxID=162156 RepID=UPI002585493A|nr:capsular polysaccharide synthesis protein [uncultured Bacteroides sp.]
MLEKIKKTVRLLVPASCWKSVRKRTIIKRQKAVADFWNPVITGYFSGNMEKYSLKPKKSMESQRIIWQYWGQGIDTHTLPEIIQICFQSVDKYKGDYQVIRLTDATIPDYLDLPAFVWEKRKNPQFTRTFFSDLLRLALLATYGGIWLDATILLTGHLPEAYKKTEFFMFQRSDEEKNKDYWENVYAYYFGWDRDFKVRVLNSVIYAQKGSQVISVLCDLLLHFWRTQNTVPDYFFFQVLFNELMTSRFPDRNSMIVNDCIPHILQTKINGTYDSFSFEEALELSNIHKMAYYDENAMERLKTVIRLKKEI